MEITYVFEVGYIRENIWLPPCIKEVKAKNANDGKKKIKTDTPEGIKIRKITLIGSRQ